MDFNALVKALVEHPAAAIAALALLGVAYLFKELRAESKAQLDLALRIAPLAEKLSDSVDAAERIVTSKGQP